MQIRGTLVLAYYHPGGKPGWVRAFYNGVTYQGVNHLLNAGFRGGFTAAQWYLGLVSNAPVPAVSANDTYASHAGWDEFPYWLAGPPGNQKRPQWSPGAAGTALLASTAPSVGTITSAGTVRGAFVSNVPSGVGSGTSVLWSTGLMSAGLAVAVGGTLSVTYSIRIREAP